MQPCKKVSHGITRLQILQIKITIFLLQLLKTRDFTRQHAGLLYEGISVTQIITINVLYSKCISSDSAYLFKVSVEYL